MEAAHRADSVVNSVSRDTWGAAFTPAGLCTICALWPLRRREDMRHDRCLGTWSSRFSVYSGCVSDSFFLLSKTPGRHLKKDGVTPAPGVRSIAMAC